ncbi:hypothetical protein AB1Y20_007305 [Prymnesium parvum]|uniref:Mitochondrial splicing suppressor 51-like C-terminal domain-containing protein n=1 Tax=Prymnesium parvum TaxID=97485 RepID=A0AB34IUW6_PRYPA
MGVRTRWRCLRRLISQRARRAARRALDSDLAAWVDLCAQRRALARRDALRSLRWEDQAAEQRLPVDRRSLALHRRCRAFIRAHRLRRGDYIHPSGGGPASPRGWAAAALPAARAHRAVATDALSFPLSAALALARLGAARRAPLTLLVLGAEPGAELRGRGKWLELLRCGAREARVLFVGPRVPRRLDGTAERRVDGAGRRVELSFARGAYHDARLRARVDAFGAAQLAVAFNSGLAEHVADWARSLCRLLRAGTPLALTSYHLPEAQLDARTLRWRFGCRLLCAAAPNPYASELPHLDELFPGRTYRANAFLTVAKPAGKW